MKLSIFAIPSPSNPLSIIKIVSILIVIFSLIGSILRFINKDIVLGFIFLGIAILFIIVLYLIKYFINKNNKEIKK